MRSSLLHKTLLLAALFQVVVYYPYYGSYYRPYYSPYVSPYQMYGPQPSFYAPYCPLGGPPVWTTTPMPSWRNP